MYGLSMNTTLTCERNLEGAGLFTVCKRSWLAAGGMARDWGRVYGHAPAGSPTPSPPPGMVPIF